MSDIDITSQLTKPATRKPIAGPVAPPTASLNNPSSDYKPEMYTPQKPIAPKYKALPKVADNAPMRTAYIPNYGINIVVPVSYSDSDIENYITQHKQIIQQASPVHQQANAMISNIQQSLQDPNKQAGWVQKVSEWATKPLAAVDQGVMNFALGAGVGTKGAQEAYQKKLNEAEPQYSYENHETTYTQPEVASNAFEALSPGAYETASNIPLAGGVVKALSGFLTPSNALITAATMGTNMLAEAAGTAGAASAAQWAGRGVAAAFVPSMLQNAKDKYGEFSRTDNVNALIEGAVNVGLALAAAKHADAPGAVKDAYNTAKLFNDKIQGLPENLKNKGYSNAPGTKPENFTPDAYVKTDSGYPTPVQKVAENGEGRSSVMDKDGRISFVPSDRVVSDQWQPTHTVNTGDGNATQVKVLGDGGPAYPGTSIVRDQMGNMTRLSTSMLDEIQQPTIPVDNTAAPTTPNVPSEVANVRLNNNGYDVNQAINNGIPVNNAQPVEAQPTPQPSALDAFLSQYEPNIDTNVLNPQSEPASTVPSEVANVRLNNNGYDETQIRNNGLPVSNPQGETNAVQVPETGAVGELANGQEENGGGGSGGVQQSVEGEQTTTANPQEGQITSAPTEQPVVAPTPTPEPENLPHVTPSGFQYTHYVNIGGNQIPVSVDLNNPIAFRAEDDEPLFKLKDENGNSLTLPADRYTPADVVNQSSTTEPVASKSGAGAETTEQQPAPTGTRQPVAQTTEPTPEQPKSQGKRAAQKKALDAIEAAADAKLKGGLSQLNAGLDPELFLNLAKKGAVKIARGAIALVDFKDQMVNEFGEKILPHINDLWQKANDLYHTDIQPQFTDLPIIKYESAQQEQKPVADNTQQQTRQPQPAPVDNTQQPPIPPRTRQPVTPTEPDINNVSGIRRQTLTEQENAGNKGNVATATVLSPKDITKVGQDRYAVGGASGAEETLARLKANSVEGLPADVAELRAHAAELDRYVSIARTELESARDAYKNDPSPQNKDRLDTANQNMQFRTDNATNWNNRIQQYTGGTFAGVGNAMQGVTDLTTGDFIRVHAALHDAVQQTYDRASGLTEQQIQDGQHAQMTAAQEASVAKMAQTIADLNTKNEAIQKELNARVAADAARNTADSGVNGKPRYGQWQTKEQVAAALKARIANKSIFTDPALRSIPKEQRGAVSINNKPIFSTQEQSAIWQIVKEHIDSGKSYGDVLQSTADDLGIPSDWVRDVVAGDKGRTPLTEDTKASMKARRDVINQAQTEVRNDATQEYFKNDYTPSADGSLSVDDARRIWQYARGNYAGMEPNLRITNVAKDLGLSRADVTKVLADPPAITTGMSDAAKVKAKEIAELQKQARVENLDNMTDDEKKAVQREQLAQNAAKAGDRIRAASPQSYSDLSPDDIRDIWKYTTVNHIDGGTPASEAAARAASELGIPEQVVRDVMAGPKSVRELSDEALAAQSRRRQAVDEAQRWAERAAMTKGQKLKAGLTNIPNAAALAYHVGVGMVTHAGTSMATPFTNGVEYWRNFANQFKYSVGSDEASRARHEADMQSMQSVPTGDKTLSYQQKLENGLDIDPAKHYDSYQQYGEYWGKIGERGNRAMDALKKFRSDWYDREYAKMSDSLKSDPKALQQLANHINVSTGVGNLDFGMFGKAMFAPSLEGARWQKVGAALKTAMDVPRMAVGAAIPALDNLSPSEKYIAIKRLQRAAEFSAIAGGTLAVNSAIRQAQGEDGVNFTDPTKGDWLKYKIGNSTIDPFGNYLSPVKLLYSLYSLSKENSGNAPVLPKDERLSAEQRLHEMAGQYEQGKLNPIAQIGVDLIQHHNFQNRPLPWASDPDFSKMSASAAANWQRYAVTHPKLSWGEYLGSKLPIPVASALEQYNQNMIAKGLDKPTADIATKAILTALVEMTGVKVGHAPESYAPKFKGQGSKYGTPTNSTDDGLKEEKIHNPSGTTEDRARVY